jgi:CHAD domain-containing protein
VQPRALRRLKAASSSSGEQVCRQLLRRQSSLILRIPALRKMVRAMLDISQQSLASRPLRKATAGHLAAGLKRIYKQRRAAFETARASPTPGHLHEWRKKVKSLGYGLELIHGLGPAKLARMRRDSDALSQALGDNHDLFLVLRSLRLEDRAFPAGDYAALARRICRKRAKLQDRAFKFGEEL